jgi:putative peptidoglycan lipid II flippase
LALLSNFLFVFGSTLGQHLITTQRYWIYGFTPILYTAGTVGGTMFLTPSIGAYGPIVGTVIGALVYAILRAADVLSTGVRLRFAVWHPDFREMGILMLPRMLSLGALQIQLLVFDSLGSALETGAISINLAARNFESVGVGIVGIALAQAVYSPLSQAAATGDHKLYTVYLRKAIGYALLLTIPGAIALTFVSPIAARLVDLTHVLPVFRVTLALYAIAIPLESLNHLLLRAYYALKDTMLPAISTVVAGVVSILIAWRLTGTLGVHAFAIAFTAGQLTQTLGLGLFLRGRLRRMRAA